MVTPPASPRKTALFVDFDNIYIGLQSLDQKAARAFATNPSIWLSWLESGMPTLKDYGGLELPQRSLLVRRCYLNPAVMAGTRDFRAHFIRAGFSVVDCPSVTGQGKNNADILMVLDIIDTLAHSTAFDEFIILSGDSDFTPVLLRLRAHDRRTSIITAGPASQAYKAAADRSIAPDLFIEFGLGLAPAPESFTVVRKVSGAAPSEDMLARMAAALYQATSTSGELEGTAVPSVLKQFEEFRRRGDWMGFGTLRRLSNDLVNREPRLQWIESDPWKIGLTEIELTAAAAVTATPATATDAGEPDGRAFPFDVNLESDIVAYAIEAVARAPYAPTMAAVAGEIIKKLPGVLETSWAGRGSFKAVLLNHPAPLPFEILTRRGTPGHLVDRGRHPLPPSSAAGEAWLGHEDAEFADLVRRVHQVTEAPLLSPSQYQMLFQMLADEVNGRGYSFLSTSKAIREQCLERGLALTRVSVGFVLRGIVFAGHDLAAAQSPVTLAEAFRTAVETQCRTARLQLNGSGHFLRRWLGGAEPPPAHPDSSLSSG